MAKTILKRLGELVIPIPAPPTKKELILNVNENRANAYWRRQEFPKIFLDYVPYDIMNGADTIYKTLINQPQTYYDQDGNLAALSVDDTEEVFRLLRQEIHRRTHGVYMKNADDLVWLAPGYYFSLQWGEMRDLPEKYGRFRHIQNNMLTTWEYVKRHPAHLILNVPKCKKSGITQIVAFDYLNESTLNERWIFGCVSKEFDAARDTNMGYYFHAFDNLPLIMKPQVVKRNLHEIKFGDPKKRRTTGAQKGDFLDTWVFGAKTKASCFDGPVMKRDWWDELPKAWEASKVSPDSLYKKGLETLRLQQRKNGAGIITTYMPEIDDRGFKEYQSLCVRSRLSTMSEDTGTTETMMINFPIPATKSNEICFDKYGYCDEDKARRIIINERATKKTSSDKQAHKRTNPLDENDMFESGGRGSTFDNLRLALRQKDLRTELESGKRPYREGHLRWRNGLWEGGNRPKDQFCAVWFEELTADQLANGEEGSILFFVDLPESMLNQVIKSNSRADDGCLCPLPNSTAIGAFDPTDYKLKRDVAEGSKNAAYGGLLDDPILDQQMKYKATDVPIFEYLWRHNDPRMTEEDLYKIMIYLGMRFLIEGNKGFLVTAAKLAGMHHFLLLIQANGNIEPYQEGDENRLVNSTRNLIEAYCRAINRYLAEPKSGSDTDYMELLRTLRLITQLMDFDVLDTKRFDAAVSFGWWRIAMDSFVIWLLNNKPPDMGAGIVGAMEALLNF